MQSNDTDIDRMSYQTWQTVQNIVESPLDRTAPYFKYILSAYLYYTSRLAVPGRAYDSDEYGMLALGGSAHVDIMDVEVAISRMSDAAKDDAYDWTMGSSQEQVAEWRKMGRGDTRDRSGISRRRDRLAEEISAGDAQKVA